MVMSEYDTWQPNLSAEPAYMEPATEDPYYGYTDPGPYTEPEMSPRTRVAQQRLAQKSRMAYTSDESFADNAASSSMDHDTSQFAPSSAYSVETTPEKIIQDLKGDHNMFGTHSAELGAVDEPDVVEEPDGFGMPFAQTPFESFLSGISRKKGPPPKGVEDLTVDLLFDKKPSADARQAEPKNENQPSKKRRSILGLFSRKEEDKEPQEHQESPAPEMTSHSTPYESTEQTPAIQDVHSSEETQAALPTEAAAPVDPAAEAAQETPYVNENEGAATHGRLSSFASMEMVMMAQQKAGEQKTGEASQQRAQPKTKEAPKQKAPRKRQSRFFGLRKSVDLLDEDPSRGWADTAAVNVTGLNLGGEIPMMDMGEFDSLDFAPNDNARRKTMNRTSLQKLLSLGKSADFSSSIEDPAEQWAKRNSVDLLKRPPSQALQDTLMKSLDEGAQGAQGMQKKVQPVVRDPPPRNGSSMNKTPTSSKKKKLGVLNVFKSKRTSPKDESGSSRLHGHQKGKRNHLIKKDVNKRKSHPLPEAPSQHPFEKPTEHLVEKHDRVLSPMPTAVANLVEPLNRSATARDLLNTPQKPKPGNAKDDINDPWRGAVSPSMSQGISKVLQPDHKSDNYGPDEASNSADIGGAGLTPQKNTRLPQSASGLSNASLSADKKENPGLDASPSDIWAQEIDRSPFRPYQINIEKAVQQRPLHNSKSSPNLRQGVAKFMQKLLSSNERHKLPPMPAVLRSSPRTPAVPYLSPSTHQDYNYEADPFIRQGSSTEMSTHHLFDDSIPRKEPPARFASRKASLTSQTPIACRESRQLMRTLSLDEFAADEALNRTTLFTNRESQYEDDGDMEQAFDDDGEMLHLSRETTTTSIGDMLPSLARFKTRSLSVDATSMPVFDGRSFDFGGRLSTLPHGRRNTSGAESDSSFNIVPEPRPATSLTLSRVPMRGESRLSKWDEEGTVSHDAEVAASKALALLEAEASQSLHLYDDEPGDDPGSPELSHDHQNKHDTPVAARGSREVAPESQSPKKSKFVLSFARAPSVRFTPYAHVPRQGLGIDMGFNTSHSSFKDRYNMYQESLQKKRSFDGAAGYSTVDKHTTQGTLQQRTRMRSASESNVSDILDDVLEFYDDPADARSRSHSGYSNNGASLTSEGITQHTVDLLSQMHPENHSVDVSLNSFLVPQHFTVGNVSLADTTVPDTSFASHFDARGNTTMLGTSLEMGPMTPAAPQFELHVREPTEHRVDEPSVWDAVDPWEGDDADILSSYEGPKPEGEEIQGRDDGADRDTVQGTSQGMDQEADHGADQGTYQGMDQGASPGMHQGTYQGMDQGASQGINQRASQGINQRASQDMDQWVSQGQPFVQGEAREVPTTTSTNEPCVSGNLHDSVYEPAEDSMMDPGHELVEPYDKFEEDILAGYGTPDEAKVLGENFVVEDANEDEEEAVFDYAMAKLSGGLGSLST